MSVVQYQLQVLYLRDLPAQLAEHSLQIESLLEQYQLRSHSKEQPNSMLDEQWKLLFRVLKRSQLWFQFMVLPFIQTPESLWVYFFTQSMIDVSILNRITVLSTMCCASKGIVWYDWSTAEVITVLKSLADNSHSVKFCRTPAWD